MTDKPTKRCPYCGKPRGVFACCPQSEKKASWEHGEFQDREEEERYIERSLEVERDSF